MLHAIQILLTKLADYAKTASFDNEAVLAHLITQLVNVTQFLKVILQAHALCLL